MSYCAAWRGGETCWFSPWTFTNINCHVKVKKPWNITSAMHGRAKRRSSWNVYPVQTSEGISVQNLLPQRAWGQQVPIPPDSTAERVSFFSGLLLLYAVGIIFFLNVTIPDSLQSVILFYRICAVSKAFLVVVYGKELDNRNILGFCFLGALSMEEKLNTPQKNLQVDVDSS